MRKIIDIAALSIAVCILVMVLFLPSPVLSFKCYRGDGVSCAQLGRDKLSRGDYEGAKPALAKACDLGYAKSCHNAGVVYYTGGFGLAADPAKATSFFERGCDGGMRDSCYNAGIAYDKGLGAPKDRHKAEKLYAKSCELGFGDACNNLGYLYLSDGDLRGFSKGLGCVKKGCDAGNKKSCEFYEFIKEKILKKQGGR